MCRQAFSNTTPRLTPLTITTGLEYAASGHVIGPYIGNSSLPDADLQGANQAVAAARLSNAKGVDSSSGSSSRRVRFISRFGNDSYAFVLRQELSGAGVDVSGCVAVPYLGSGLGLVMLEPDGAASSVVVGGANTAWTEVREGERGEGCRSRRAGEDWINLVGNRGMTGWEGGNKGGRGAIPHTFTHLCCWLRGALIPCSSCIMLDHQHYLHHHTSCGCMMGSAGFWQS